MKESLLSHIQTHGKIDKKIIAESNLYNDWCDESSGLKPSQQSLLVKNSQQRNHYSEQEYLYPHEEFEEEDTLDINYFKPKGSVKLTRNVESKNQKKIKVKNKGLSAEKKGRNHYSSNGQKKNGGK